MKLLFPRCVLALTVAGVLFLYAPVRAEEENAPVSLGLMDAIHLAEQKNTRSLLAAERVNEAKGLRLQKAHPTGSG